MFPGSRDVSGSSRGGRASTSSRSPPRMSVERSRSGARPETLEQAASTMETPRTTRNDPVFRRGAARATSSSERQRFPLLLVTAPPCSGRRSRTSLALLYRECTTWWRLAEIPGRRTGGPNGIRHALQRLPCEVLSTDGRLGSASVSPTRAASRAVASDLGIPSSAAPGYRDRPIDGTVAGRYGSGVVDPMVPTVAGGNASGVCSPMLGTS